MNVIESAQIVGPYGTQETCAMFSIDTVTDGFVFQDVTIAGEKYAFSCWVRSENEGQVSIAGELMNTAETWEKKTHVFTAENEDLEISFENAGVYYLCYTKLERGNKTTDWTVAPEDQTNEFALLENRVTNVETNYAEFSVEQNTIKASVQHTREQFEGSVDDLDNRVNTLTQEVSARMTAQQVQLQIQSAMESGAEKIVTSTGFTFDDLGLTVEKSGTEMKTQITEDGMTVYQNDLATLEANNQGVNARNLNATTYLSVGGRSRFENYGSDRTGCFWTGG